jgi:hypothetical protein
MKKYYFIRPDPVFHSNLMAFGFECDKGWYPLIEEAFDKMEKAIDKMPKKERNIFKNSFEILQVKEKLGGLRIYINIYTDEIIKIIVEAEEKAEKTCEVCGKPGKMREINHWLFTNCEEDYNKKLKELK